MSPLITRKSSPWLLLVSDFIGLIISFELAFWLRLGKPLGLSSPLLYLIITIALLGLYLADTYRLDIRIAGLWAPARVIISLLVTFGITNALIYLAGWWGTTPIVGRGVWSLALLFFIIWAVISRIITYRGLKIALTGSRWLVMGDEDSATQIQAEYRCSHPAAEFVYCKETVSAASVLSHRPTTLLLDERDRQDDFSRLCQQNWTGILIDPHSQTLSDENIRELMQIRLDGTYIYNFAEFAEETFGKIPPAFIQDEWFAFTAGFGLFHNRINLKLKRLFDLVVAGFVFLLVLPVGLITMIAIKLDSPGSVFYHQTRTGTNGKLFKVHKFRSMTQNAEKAGAQWASTQDSRITRVGKLIRLMRIDELPQLWNVLTGEMSLIGPRPERPEFDKELRQQIPYYDIRYLIKPGITGWAQVKYPYGASVEDAYQKVAYDLYYIKNYSLFLDFAIVLKTLRVVILGKGR